jgi:hypothetical protein
MNTRIETTHAPTRLLGELPARWAQAIITSPTRADIDRAPAALFAQLSRVLRGDGTLWLLCSEQEIPRELAQHGWLLRPVVWGNPRQAAPACLHLFVKQEHYHYNSQVAEAFRAPHTGALTARTAGQHCCCVTRSLQRRELLRRCVLASSARTACGACGAPYTRTDRGPQPSCRHNDPRSRCLILDPFYRPASGAHEITQRHGRAFLGITQGEQG